MVSRILKRAAESVEKRADDNEATIKNRIETFVKNTDEILSQYPTQTLRVSCVFTLISIQISFENLFNHFVYHRLTVNVMSIKFSMMFLKPSLRF